MRIEGTATDQSLTMACDIVADVFEVNGQAVTAEALVTLPIGLVGEMLKDAIGDAFALIAEVGVAETEAVETTRFTYDESGRISGKVVERPSLGGHVSRFVREARSEQPATERRRIGFRSPEGRGS
jgi:YD repeat-containing protein